VTKNGKRLRQLREHLGLSPADLRRSSGITSSEISLWESGAREVPRTDRVRQALARGLRLDVRDLVSYLEGFIDLSFVIDPSRPLAQAIAIGEKGRWSPSAIAAARALEATHGALPAADWVRVLDALEKAIAPITQSSPLVHSV
jgi:transcriptional regulator with XRE-family HTH domain